jgi:hypothetical protein
MFSYVNTLDNSHPHEFDVRTLEEIIDLAIAYDSLTKLAEEYRTREDQKHFLSRALCTLSTFIRLYFNVYKHTSVQTYVFQASLRDALACLSLPMLLRHGSLVRLKNFVMGYIAKGCSSFQCVRGPLKDSCVVENNLHLQLYVSASYVLIYCSPLSLRASGSKI